MKLKNTIAGIITMSVAYTNCFGQGLVRFANNQANSAVYLGAGNTTLATLAANPNIRIGLFWGASGASDLNLAQISSGGVTGNSLTNGLVTIAGFTAGTYSGGSLLTGTSTGTAEFQIRAWDITGGATWDSFINNSANIGVKNYGVSSLITATPLQGAGTPPNVPGTDPTATVHLLVYSSADAAHWGVVPEPATYALGMMGLGLAWLIRRRQA